MVRVFVNDNFISVTLLYVSAQITGAARPLHYQKRKRNTSELTFGLIEVDQGGGFGAVHREPVQRRMAC